MGIQVNPDLMQSFEWLIKPLDKLDQFQRYQLALELNSKFNNSRTFYDQIIQMELDSDFSQLSQEEIEEREEGPEEVRDDFNIRGWCTGPFGSAGKLAKVLQSVEGVLSVLEIQIVQNINPQSRRKILSNQWPKKPLGSGRVIEHPEPYHYLLKDYRGRSQSQLGFFKGAKQIGGPFDFGRFNCLDNNTRVGDIAFHVSPVSNRRSIQESGLKAPRPEDRLWSYMQEPAVYLHSNFLGAVFWEDAIRDRLNDYGGTHCDIWVVQADGLDIQLDTCFQGGVRTFKPIHQNRMFRLEQQDLLEACRNYSDRDHWHENSALENEEVLCQKLQTIIEVESGRTVEFIQPYNRFSEI